MFTSDPGQCASQPFRPRWLWTEAYYVYHQLHLYKRRNLSFPLVLTQPPNNQVANRIMTSEHAGRQRYSASQNLAPPSAFEPARSSQSTRNYNPQRTTSQQVKHTYNSVTEILNGVSSDRWNEVLGEFVNTVRQTPQEVLPEESNNHRPEDILLTSFLASQGLDPKPGYPKPTYRTFSWLNQMNLLLYQHELIAMEYKYRQDITTLLEPGETEKMRTLIEKYSSNTH
jgi:hypothetical protein